MIRLTVTSVDNGVTDVHTVDVERWGQAFRIIFEYGQRDAATLQSGGTVPARDFDVQQVEP